MDIIISNSIDKPIYEQISSQLKKQIMDSKLLPGDPLPSIRMLAKELHVSIITIQKAYDSLQREGFIDSVVGKGSFVSEINKEFIREEKLRAIEENLEKAVLIAKENGITLEKLKELLELFY